MSEAIRFSVVIPVKNDEGNIFKCLSSLVHLSYPSEQFEVIVVDNGSTDGTLAVVEGFRSSLPLCILVRPNIYISALRNAGVLVARGEWIAFLDSDCETKPDWLLEAQKAISEGIVGVFGSFYVIPPGSSWIARTWYGEREWKPKGEISYLPAGNLFIKKQNFEALGGFNANIQTNEDFELCERARHAGFSVLCIPEVGVIHWGTPQTLREFYKKNRWHGTHVLRVFLQNFPRLLNLKPLLLAFYTALCLLGGLFCLAFAIFTGHTTPLLIVITALLLPPCLLGLTAAAKTNKPESALPMATLFLVYALARASCLVQTPSWRTGKRLHEADSL